jgi:hypothetical protein
LQKKLAEGGFRADSLGEHPPTLRSHSVFRFPRKYGEHWRVILRKSYTHHYFNQSTSKMNQSGSKHSVGFAQSDVAASCVGEAVPNSRGRMNNPIMQ